MIRPLISGDGMNVESPLTRTTRPAHGRGGKQEVVGVLGVSIGADGLQDVCQREQSYAEDD